MRLTRALPPQFLLPAWGTRKSYQALQQAHRALQPQACFYISNGRQHSKKKTPRSNIFEELFPEERKKRDDLEREKQLEKLPPFEWNERSEAGLTGREVKEEQIREQHQPVPMQKDFDFRGVSSQETLLRREASVLILSGASKTLEESDFFRVSPKGEHIEGWTSGILKVIPSRDATTLEHETTYFIFFSSDAAARAYLDQTIRLHELSRLHQGSLAAATPPPPDRDPRDQENLKSTLDAFTLVPGHNKLLIRISHSPRSSVTQMLASRRTNIMARRERRGEVAILFSLDNAQLLRQTVYQALAEDGVRRNLHWGLALEDIWGLWSNALEDRDDELFDQMLGGAELRAGNTKPTFRLPSRYVLFFKHRNVARRFVREWHRRPLPARHALGSFGEPPPIVDAEIIW